MHATRRNDQIVLTFGSFETQTLERAFGSMLRHYRAAPEQLDPRIAGVWYSTRGCRTAGMSEEETREWRQALRGFKSANLKLIESWARQLLAGKGNSRQLRLTRQESDALLSVVNDHRLLLAAQHEIGQAEMDVHSLEALRELKPGQQFALCEIHLLAWIMEEILRATAPEAANWQ
jgi:hypothetical protein